MLLFRGVVHIHYNKNILLKYIRRRREDGWCYEHTTLYLQYCYPSIVDSEKTVYGTSNVLNMKLQFFSNASQFYIEDVYMYILLHTLFENDRLVYAQIRTSLDSYMPDIHQYRFSYDDNDGNWLTYESY